MQKEIRLLLQFFLFTFAATWVAYGIIIVFGLNPYTMPGMVCLLIGGSSPSWVGVLMVLFTYSTEQKKDFFRRCFNFRQIRLPYWLFMLFFPILMMLLLILIDHAAGNALPGMTNLKSYLTAPITILFPLFMSFLSGPWSEEFGWRGFALDPLLKRYGALRGSILLGSIWAIWHLPLYFMPQTWHGQIGFRLAGFWSFVLYSIGLTLVMTWVFLCNGHSILSGFVLHLTNNFTGQTFGPYSDQIEIMRSLTMLMLGFVLILTWKTKEKKRLLL